MFAVDSTDSSKKDTVANTYMMNSVSVGWLLPKLHSNQIMSGVMYFFSESLRDTKKQPVRDCDSNKYKKKTQLISINNSQRCINVILPKHEGPVLWNLVTTAFYSRVTNVVKQVDYFIKSWILPTPRQPPIQFSFHQRWRQLFTRVFLSLGCLGTLSLLQFWPEKGLLAPAMISSSAILQYLI